MEMKKCPKCSKQMNPVFNKTNERAPDFKCQDSSCKWKNVKGQWVESEFITGVWKDTPDTPVEKFTQSLDKDLNDQKWDKIGRGKTRCVIAVALIGKGIKAGEEALAELNLWTDMILEKENNARPMTDKEKEEIPPEEYEF